MTTFIKYNNSFLKFGGNFARLSEYTLTPTPPEPSIGDKVSIFGMDFLARTPNLTLGSYTYTMINEDWPVQMEPELYVYNDHNFIIEDSSTGSRCLGVFNGAVL